MHDILIPCVASGYVGGGTYLHGDGKRPVKRPEQPKIDYMHAILALGYAQ